MAKKAKKGTTKGKTDWPVHERVDFVDELNEELSGSERAAILVAASMLDELLRRLLGRFLVDCKATDELLANSPSAPLGSFSARIMAAFSLGLINANEYKAFNLIRAIRNDYAHRLRGELDREVILDRVRELVSDLDKQGLALPGQKKDLRLEAIKYQVTTVITVYLQGLGLRLEHIDQIKRQQLADLVP